MTPELTVLALAGLLQVIQFVLMAVPTNMEIGTRKTMGSRDDDIKKDVSPRTGRLIRAMNNHFEALILFTIAVVVVTLANQSSPVTVTCAWVYLAARILYIPAYAFGWAPWRSLIWCVGMASTVIILVDALI
ncbi:MAPEG family protein [Pseudaestuariivita rosea]|uniref:MAPEG family protein n=1 Tax=Pseudaestuariivita rosea TaxID=2763263 RepID=UPI001ABAB07F|nr:MAPEG family protein [Pseudaestuariivita rosea]